MPLRAAPPASEDYENGFSRNVRDTACLVTTAERTPESGQMKYAARKPENGNERQQDHDRDDED
jgi:hypothetical protein